MKHGLFFFGLVCMAFSAGAQAADPVKIDKPELKVGDFRIFSVLDSLTKTEQRLEDIVVTEVSASGIQMLDRTSSVVAVYDADFALAKFGDRTYSPPIRVLAFPLEVGKKWEHTNVYVHPQCGKTTSDLKNEVIGWEDITLPAGNFRALRVDSKGYWKNFCGSDRLAYKFWYAPNVKGIVKSESLTYSGGRLFEGLVRELKSYQVN